jgi:hypothetical protein
MQALEGSTSARSQLASCYLLKVSIARFTLGRLAWKDWAVKGRDESSLLGVRILLMEYSVDRN